MSAIPAHIFLTIMAPKNLQTNIEAITYLKPIVYSKFQIKK